VAEMGLSARTREKTGHCSNAGGLSAVLRVSLYRNRRCRVFAAGTLPSQRILDASHRFPEPCGHVGPQPSPKHVAGEPMKSSASSPSPPPAA